MAKTFRRAALSAALTIAAAQTAHPQVAYPGDNPPSPIKIELGRRLFHDADLSINGTMACATCHEQHRSFADGNRTHPGALDHPGKRNVPGLQNVALLKHFTWASHLGESPGRVTWASHLGESPGRAGRPSISNTRRSRRCWANIRSKWA